LDSNDPRVSTANKAIDAKQLRIIKVFDGFIVAPRLVMQSPPQKRNEKHKGQKADERGTLKIFAQPLPRQRRLEFSLGVYYSGN
jgi:hypothetical protein